MYLIIGFAMIVGVIVVGTLIPPDARYEIWPHRRRLKKFDAENGDEDECWRSWWGPKRGESNLRLAA